MVSGKQGSRSSSAARKAALDRLVSRLADGRLYTLGELFREERIALERPTALALGRRATIFARNVGVMGEDDLAPLHVCSREAAPRALEHDDVLLGILHRKATMGTTRAHTLAQLSDMVPPRDKAPFKKLLEARDKEGRWPEGVGAIRGLNTTLVFLLKDAVRGNLPAPTPEPEPAIPTNGAAHKAATNGKDFAHDFGEAFDKLRRERRVNLVSLSSLRKALPGYPREDFDRELYELRRANQFVLESYDGRHGKPKAEELEAAIEEGGRRFIYVSRRDHD